MGWEDKFVNITWEDFRKLSLELADKLAASKQKFDLIVAIARGGLTLAQLLSDSLKLPIASFTVQSYKNLKQEKVPQIVYGLKGTLKGKRIILADDVSDSGKTFVRGLSYLEELGADKKLITTAALHFKPHSVYTPDFFVDETPKWIIYPYEAHETMQHLVKEWSHSGIAKTEIKKRFTDFEFPTPLINKALRT